MRALVGPGSDSTSARVAEWARDHGLSPVIDQAERWQYQLHPPRVGGAPPGGLPHPPTVSAILPAPRTATSPSALGRRRHRGRAPAPTSTTAPGWSAPSGTTPAPAPVVPAVQPALAGEGQWTTITAVGGVPALRETFVRPDAQHSSYVAGIGWLDPRVVAFTLHPGTTEPGHGPWREPADIPSSAASSVVATFNSGFRLADARGGYAEDGRTVGTLRTGAAAFVIRSDGTATVGQWGRDVSAGPDVVAVRQNLDLIADGGRVVPGIDDNVSHRWGATLGNKLFVWRSGVGVTGDGAIVYVAGNGLSAGTLADLLVRAGAVRGMELDINPEWTSFMSWSAGTPSNLLPDMQRPATRYDSVSTRDFISAQAR